MGRTREKKQTSATLGDFILKRGLRKRQKRLKWKQRDNQRSTRKGRRLQKRGRRQARKYRALETKVLAREVEAYDRRQEEANREQRELQPEPTPQDEAATNATAAAPPAGRPRSLSGRHAVMADVGSGHHAAVFGAENKAGVANKGRPDEGAFRAHVLTSVLQTLFPPAQAGAEKEPIQLDELNQFSMRRILEGAVFWQAKRQAVRYSDLYWFVPDARLAECFVTPRAVARLFEELAGAEVALERALRVMLLKAIHRALPGLRHTVLRSLQDWASAHLQHEAAAARRGSHHAPALPTDGPCANGFGLVELFAALVERCCPALVQSADAPAVPAFADPAAILSRALGSFIKSPALLAHHSEILGAAAAQLAHCRPALGQPMLSLVLAKWPRRDSKKELGCVHFLAALLGAMAPDAAFGPGALPGAAPADVAAAAKVRSELSKRLALLVQSPQAQVATEAMEAILGNMYIFLRYVVASPEMSKPVSEALYNARSHWSERVREPADKLFDRMLDFAQ